MFIRYPSRQHEVPLRVIIPNLLTTCGLCSGLASLHLSIKGDFDRAVGAILVAAVFDMLDGRAARLLRASSKFGAVLDSLSDFLCFGVAPALLMHQWMLREAPTEAETRRWMEALILGAIMLFALCSALRLARFTAAANSAKESPRGSRPNPLTAKFFVGLPTPAAALAVLIPVMLEMSKSVGTAPNALAIVPYTVALAWLMVSRQPMFSFKTLRIIRPLVVPLMLGVGLWIALAAKDFWLAIALMSGAYLATLPVSIVSYARTVRRLAAQPAEAEAVSVPANEVAPGVPAD